MSKSTLDRSQVSKIAALMFSQPFTRREWNDHTDRPVSSSTIVTWFGSWNNFINTIAFSSTKYDGWSVWARETFSSIPTRSTWDQHPTRPVHSDTIHQHIGWNVFIRLTYGASIRISPNATDDEVRQWIENSTGRNESNCWIASTVGDDKYGRITRNGKSEALHIASYKLFRGNPLCGEVLRHTCDNKACCNPAHLIAGSRNDNAKDFISRGHMGRKKGVRPNRPQNMSDDELVAWLLATSNQVGECLLFPTPHQTSGYVVLQINKQNWQAHRFIRCHQDGFPKNHPLLVRHVCGNRSCLNPDHLKWGSHSDNRLDDIRAGKNVKITPDIRDDIRLAWHQWGHTKAEFDRKYSIKYGVSAGTIRNTRI